MSNPIVRRLSFEKSEGHRPRRFDFVLEEGAISSESYFAFRLPSSDLPEQHWITKELLGSIERDLKEQLDILKDLKKELEPAQLEARDGKKVERFSRKTLLVEHRAERQKLLKDER